jgi:CheY-like chemotaxis protein
VVSVAPVAPASPPGSRLKVVIANESLAFCDAVSKILADEPFEIFVCTDGKEALDTVERVRPELLLLDVALPTMFGFEVCERARQNPDLSSLKIVLIASIYDKTRYKRSPKSLYGADDYLEKHHIPDSLIPMIHRLVSGSAPLPTTPSPGELALQEKSRDEIRQAELRQTQADLVGRQTLPEPAELPRFQTVEVQPPRAEQDARPVAPPTELSEAQLKARRLARIIVSDISLYSQGKVEQGVREGNFYTLLADDIREGELFYRQRVPDTVREAGSYLTEAFEDLIAKKRAELSV